jgi:hypothetical protein
MLRWYWLTGRALHGEERIEGERKGGREGLRAALGIAAHEDGEGEWGRGMA